MNLRRSLIGGLLLAGLVGALALAGRRASTGNVPAPAAGAPPASPAPAAPTAADRQRRELALAETYAGAAASLRGTLVELRARNEAPEVIDSVVKKLAELDDQARLHRTLAAPPPSP
jgi:hypothetical protein